MAYNLAHSQGVRLFEIVIVVLLLCYHCMMFHPHKCTSLIIFGQVVCQIYLL